MNLNRVPLNVLVVTGTYVADYAPAQVAFGAVGVAFLMGAALQGALIASISSAAKKTA